MNLTTTDLVRREPDGELPSTPLPVSERLELFTLAKRGLVSRQLNDARDVLHGLLVLERGNAGYWSLLGEVERAAGKPNDACEAFSMSLSYDGQQLDVAVQLVELLGECGETTRAWRLATWIAGHPNCDDAKLRRVAPILAALPTERGES
ncbi:MAG: hypothetical protein AAF219_03070 [Myxococcota bacterium]